MIEGRILRRQETRLSPWVVLVSKEVAFSPDQPPEVYHAISQPDYVAVLAQTPGGLIPLVRQYRPAMEQYTWELPAGLVDEGETPEETCRRELKEEAGLHAITVTALGTYDADTGRLENQIHAFYVKTADPDPKFVPEDNLTLDYVTAQRLKEYILSGKFRHQLHLGLLALASMRGIPWD